MLDRARVLAELSAECESQRCSVQGGRGRNRKECRKRRDRQIRRCQAWPSADALTRLATGCHACNPHDSHVRLGQGLPGLQPMVRIAADGQALQCPAPGTDKRPPARWAAHCTLTVLRSYWLMYRVVVYFNVVSVMRAKGGERALCRNRTRARVVKCSRTAINFTTRPNATS
jgi:hypothetical protein